MRAFTVCVVDDCIDEACVLSEGLRLHDYEVVTAHTGAEALRLCAAGEVDLLLLDVGLPDIDGYEVCRRLKADPATRETAVIFVTAKGAAEQVSEGFDLGAVDYIAKPYNLPIVMIRVDAAMRTLQVGDYLRTSSDTLHDPMYTDQLTGLRNRRFLMERLHEECEKAHRFSYPISCMILDVDEVQPLDHDMGAPPLDDLLAEMALMMRSSSRTYDILARFDGPTFAAVLPHAQLHQAIAYAHKIHQEAESVPFSVPTFPALAKLSTGIVACRNGSTRSADDLVGAAMRCLFKAKNIRDGHTRIAGEDLSPTQA